MRYFPNWAALPFKPGSKKETLPQRITLIDPDEFETEYYNGIPVKVLKWQITANSNEMVVINYKIKPDNLGDYSIKPTMVTYKKTNNVYKSQVFDFFVNCDSNNICEKNENSLNCAEDCKTGIKDNICDYKLDNACDPDCEEDPDCGEKPKSSLTFIILILAVALIIYLIKRFKK